jgi:hypothetical protein
LTIGFESRNDDPAFGADTYFFFGGEAPIVHVSHQAACAIAALLDLAAIGIEDAVIEISVGSACALDLQDLVTSHTEMAIGEEAKLIETQLDRIIDRVEHDKIVSQPLHFRELQIHARADSGAAAESVTALSMM